MGKTPEANDMSKPEKKRICIQSDCAVRDVLLTQINELKKKRSQGEINEAYAKTIERQDIERQKQSLKLNKRNQKIDKLEKELQELKPVSRDHSKYCGKGLCEANAFKIEIRQLENKLQKYKDVVGEITDLINESSGVTGLHLNGEMADWDWLMNNTWLEALNQLEGGSE